MAQAGATDPQGGEIASDTASATVTVTVKKCGCHKHEGKHHKSA